MTEEQKTQVRAQVNTVAAQGAKKAAAAAKKATGWKKWVLAMGAIIAGAVAWFTQGCTPANVEQLQMVHEVYHIVAGEDDCLLAQPAPFIIIQPEK